LVAVVALIAASPVPTMQTFFFQLHFWYNIGTWML